MIIPLGRRLLEEYCRLGRRILSQVGNENLYLSFNLSASQMQDETTVASISEMLDHHAIKPSQVGIEITESAILANAAKSTKVMLLLADMGIRIFIDDFGSGYCSLSFLKHLPIGINGYLLAAE